MASGHYRAGSVVLAAESSSTARRRVVGHPRCVSPQRPDHRPRRIGPVCDGNRPNRGRGWLVQTEGLLWLAKQRRALSWPSTAASGRDAAAWNRGTSRPKEAGLFGGHTPNRTDPPSDVQQGRTVPRHSGIAAVSLLDLAATSPPKDLALGYGRAALWTCRAIRRREGTGFRRSPEPFRRDGLFPNQSMALSV